MVETKKPAARLKLNYKRTIALVASLRHLVPPVFDRYFCPADLPRFLKSSQRGRPARKPECSMDCRNYYGVRQSCRADPFANFRVAFG